MSYQLFRPLSDERYQALKADIAKRGVQVPIEKDGDGNVLDGHHRLRAVHELRSEGAEVDDPPVLSRPLLSEDEKRDHILKLNLLRRQLGPVEWGEQFMRLLDERGVETGRGANQGDHSATVAECAEEIGVPLRTAERRMKLARDLNARPDLAEQVDRGEISAKDAQQTVRKEQAEADRECGRQQRAEETCRGSATVTRADAVGWLERIESGSVDLLLTDPPYSTDVDNIQDFAGWWLPHALEKVAAGGRAYVCVGAYPRELHAYLDLDSTTSHMSLKDVLVWTYRNVIGPDTDGYRLNWQAVLHFAGPDAPPLRTDRLVEKFAVMDISAPDGRHEGRLHKWEKPRKMAELIVRLATDEGGSVIDPFAGTGTFLAAAARAGRHARGCDLDEEMLGFCEQKGVERV